MSKLERALIAIAAVVVIVQLALVPLWRLVATQLETPPVLPDAGPQHFDGITERAQDLVRCALQTKDPVKYVKENVRKENADDARVLEEALQMLGVDSTKRSR